MSGIATIPGLSVGHAQDDIALTGCTVVLFPRGTVGGVDQRGGAPGTRETDLLRPLHLVNEVHAVLLTGGSAFGLDAASGVMQYLEERGIGVETGAAVVPIVAAAVIYDLDIGSAHVRPGREMGYHACLSASTDRIAQGSVGAGAGARVGSILGVGQAMKSGIGEACLEIQPGLFVGAIFCVNAFGDILDIETGQVIAGARNPQQPEDKPGNLRFFADTLEVMRSLPGSALRKFAAPQNTVIGLVATNGRLNKEEVNKVAQMAQDGIARVVKPAHTMLDGDTIFAAATGQHPADVNLVGAYAAQTASLAINHAVRAARSAGGLPAYADIQHDLKDE